MFTAAGKSAAVSAANYIEDVFSTYLYTGNGSTQTITNGIDLSGKGGLVWIKSRSNATGHHLSDTATGITNFLSSDATFSQQSGGGVTSANSNGFGLTASGGGVRTNTNGNTYVSWTFREQAKFFDVVTFTKNASTNQRVSHNLGATPGCIMVKSTDAVGNWTVWHRSLASATDSYMILNSTGAASATANAWGSTGPTSTDFGVSSVQFTNGTNYVAYLFAHDAGGFGATGSDNVISCGSFTSATSTINLGYEPQFILFKASNGTGNWRLVDNMRGLPASGNPQELYPNLSQAEASNGGVNITSTGFTQQMNDFTYIYIAIRRGPMKTPTSGTSVYYATSQQDTNSSITPNFPVDLAIDRYQYQNVSQTNQAGTSYVYDRLRGTNAILQTNSTSAEVNAANGPSFYVSTTGFQSNTKLNIGPGDGTLNNDYAYFWTFRRAPGFFDVVCYTGTSAARTISHNLTVVPELIIVKSRSAINNWTVYSAATGNTNALILNSTAAVSGPDPGDWNSTTPTASVFSLGGNGRVNASAANYVAYLFATCPGVSKVGSYTGTGALQTINCGFAAGARFILIKRTDSTGDWYVYDSARGITSGNDPYLFLNSTAAEVTNTNYVDTASTGFQVTAAAPAGLNANGGTYIFLAIA